MATIITSTQQPTKSSPNDQPGAGDGAKKKHPKARVPRAFALLFALTGIVMLAVIQPLWVPLFLGVTLAVSLAPVHRLLTGAIGGRATLSAALMTLLVLSVIIAPLVSLVAYGANEVTQGIAWAKEALQIDNLKEISSGQMPNVMRRVVTKATDSLSIGADDVEKVGKQALDFLQRATPALAGASLSFVGNLVMVLISCFFFFSEGQALLDVLLRTTPLRRMHTREILSDFRAVATASLMGMAFTAISQSLVLTVGFYFAGLPHLFFFGVLALISAFVPVAATATVWLPVAIGLGAMGHTHAALGVAGWSVFATNFIDTVLKPMVLKGRMPLHGALTFLGILGGLTLFGPVGVIAGPLCIALFTTFLRMYERDYLANNDTHGEV